MSIWLPYEAILSHAGTYALGIPWQPLLSATGLGSAMYYYYYTLFI